MLPNYLLQQDEKAIYELRELYRLYGYTPYKMSKFEEYDLYVANKNFLVSNDIITFTDTNGKLMAMKPDVTLSIVKNSQYAPNSVQKLYYNENVYRVSKNSKSFREIMQTGLECLGDIDDYQLSEVVFLAQQSLSRLSGDYVLDVSHLGILSDAIDSLGIGEEDRPKVIAAVGEKNVNALEEIGKKAGLSASAVDSLKLLVTCYGEPEKVLSSICEAFPASSIQENCRRLLSILKPLDPAHVHVDFSVINDFLYYNGIVFQGFIPGIPQSILSGGQYDNLMKKMGQQSRAIGFAVYLDLLESLPGTEDNLDADIVLQYEEGADPDKVSRTVARYTSEGKRVLAVRRLPEKLRYKEMIQLKESGEN